MALFESVVFSWAKRYLEPWSNKSDAILWSAKCTSVYLSFKMNIIELRAEKQNSNDSALTQCIHLWSVVALFSRCSEFIKKNLFISKAY